MTRRAGWVDVWRRCGKDALGSTEPDERVVAVAAASSFWQEGAAVMDVVAKNWARRPMTAIGIGSVLRAIRPSIGLSIVVAHLLLAGCLPPSTVLDLATDAETTTSEADATTDTGLVRDEFEDVADMAPPDDGSDADAIADATVGGGPLPAIVDLSWSVSATTATGFFGSEFAEWDQGGLGPTQGFVTAGSDGLHLGQPGNWSGAVLTTVRTFDTHVQDVTVGVLWQVDGCDGYGPSMGLASTAGDGGWRVQLTSTAGSWNVFVEIPGQPTVLWPAYTVKCTPGEQVGFQLRFRQGGGARLTSLDGTQSFGWLDVPPQAGLMAFVRNHSGGPAVVKQLQVTAPASVPEPLRIAAVEATPLGTRVDWQPGKLHGGAIQAVRWTRVINGVEALQPEVLPTTSPAMLPVTEAGVQWGRLIAVSGSGPSEPSAPFVFSQWQALAVAPVIARAQLVGSFHAGAALTARADLVDANADALPLVRWTWQSGPGEAGPWTELASDATDVTVPPPAAAGQWWRAMATAKGAADLATPPVKLAGFVDVLGHVLVTGQSLSLGTAGTPALSTAQPYTNLGWSAGQLVPLLETGQESPASGLGNGLTWLNAPTPLDVAVTKHGVEATPYAGLRKGTEPYALGQQQVSAVAKLAKAQGRGYAPLGVVAIHGEADDVSGGAWLYENELREWQEDYESDMVALTGVVRPLPLFICQLSSYQHPGINVALMQVAAAHASGGRIVLVTPKYMLNYSGASPHLEAASYRLLGEYYAKVIHQVSVLGVPWQPLEPLTAALAGQSIDIRYHVPVPPLVFDTTAVVAAQDMGFKYLDDADSTAIDAVEIVGIDTVRVHLKAPPTGKNPRIAYALNLQPDASFGANSSGSGRGNLRDSDATTLASGTALHNWSIHAVIAVFTAVP